MASDFPSLYTVSLSCSGMNLYCTGVPRRMDAQVIWDCVCDCCRTFAEEGVAPRGGVPLLEPHPTGPVTAHLLLPPQTPLYPGPRLGCGDGSRLGANDLGWSIRVGSRIVLDTPNLEPRIEAIGEYRPLLTCRTRSPAAPAWASPLCSDGFPPGMTWSRRPSPTRCAPLGSHR